MALAAARYQVASNRIPLPIHCPTTAQEAGELVVFHMTI